jgi:hypothetical protein
MILTHSELDVTLVSMTHPWSWRKRVENYCNDDIVSVLTLWIPAEDDWMLGIHFPYTLIELLWGGV